MLVGRGNFESELCCALTLVSNSDAALIGRVTRQAFQ
jgi:hypothetical protein